MVINENKLINVLNFNANPVAIKTHKMEYLCTSAENYENPSITPLTYSEIESLNSNSNAFKIGTLRFPIEIEAEIYEALRITDWKDILTNKDIENIILKPSIAGLTKLVDIKNVSLFERVRGVFFSLNSTHQYDISNRVEAIITTRYKELANKQIKTNIVLTVKDTNTSIPNEEVDALKEQNKSMQTQMEAMQKMMEQMLAMQTNNTSKSAIEVEKKDVEVAVIKKATKPKATK